MTKLEHSVIINRPVEEVFEFMTNPENEKKYRTDLLEMEVTSEGPMGVGSTTREVAQFLGRKIETTGEVTEHVKNKVVATKSTSGPIPFTFRTRFEPVEEGTKVTMEFEGEIGGFFKMAESLVVKMGMKQIEKDFSKVKDLLEAEALGKA
jgi:uncharacterized membrane protein